MKLSKTLFQSKIYILLLIVLSLPSTSACFLAAGMMEGKRVGEEAVTRFHSRYNAQQYDEIYDKSDKRLQDVTSKDQLRDLLDKVRATHGEVKGFNVTSFNVHFTPTEKTVTLACDSEFAKGRATESFVFVVHGNGAKLVGYNINSPLFIVTQSQDNDASREILKDGKVQIEWESPDKASR